jgi:hypothetical protein
MLGEMRAGKLATAEDQALLSQLVTHPKVSEKAKQRLQRILTRLTAGGGFEGTDSVYIRGVRMALFAESEGIEDLILQLRMALIKNNGNVTAAADSLQWYRPDAWSLIDEHPGIFRDLLNGKCEGSTHLLGTLTMHAEMRSAQKALRIADGNVALAAEILGINRTTLHERLKKYVVDYQKEMDVSCPDVASSDLTTR